MLKVIELGQTLETEPVLRTLFDLRRRPSRIRIACPIITQVILKDFNFLKGLTRLSASGTTVTIITEDFVENKKHLVEKAESMKREFARGKISEDLYKNRSGAINRRIQRVEETEKLFKGLRALKASIFRRRRLHAKVIIVESQEETLALLMSSNITTSGLSKNIEIGIMLNDEECVNKINGYLDKIIDFRGTLPYDLV